jgi:galactokinase
MTRFYRVPGRIELLGKHVDYAGGQSLTCAVDRALSVRVEVLQERVVRLRSTTQPPVELPLSTRAEMPAAIWGTYARAVIRRLCRDFPEIHRGIEITIASDLPASAGLSSSSALTIALATLGALAAGCCGYRGPSRIFRRPRDRRAIRSI